MRIYRDPYALVWWPGDPDRPPIDDALLAAAAGLWDAVSAARGDDPPPPPTIGNPVWAIVGSGRYVAWNGGGSDAP